MKEMSGFNRLILLICLLGAGCARMELEERSGAMRRVEPEDVPRWSDDLPPGPLIEALEKNQALLGKSPRFTSLQFGERVVSSKDYALGLKHLINLLKSSRSLDEVWEDILKDFDFYQVYGGKKWGEVLITSYFEPVIRGRFRRKFPYTQPLYKLPSDLVEMKPADWEKPGLEDAPSILERAPDQGSPFQIGTLLFPCGN